MPRRSEGPAGRNPQREDGRMRPPKLSAPRYCPGQEPPMATPGGRGASRAVKSHRGHPPTEGRDREGTPAALPGPGRGSGSGSGRVPPGPPGGTETGTGGGGRAACPQRHLAAAAGTAPGTGTEREREQERGRLGRGSGDPGRTGSRGIMGVSLRRGISWREIPGEEDAMGRSFPRVGDPRGGDPRGGQSHGKVAPRGGGSRGCRSRGEGDPGGRSPCGKEARSRGSDYPEAQHPGGCSHIPGGRRSGKGPSRGHDPGQG